MSFDSLNFWIFFAAVFLLYSRLERRRQNILLLAASYFFYYSLEKAFLGLLLFTTVFDYWCGRLIEDSPSKKHKQIFLLFSVCSNICMLLAFKYFRFFFPEIVEAFGVTSASTLLAAAIPAGISFYILQSMSYVIDVYRNDCPAHRRLSEYALYIAFFPQLVAGPIERAGKILPQLVAHRVISRTGLREGAWLCAWGLIEKCVVSDNIQAFVINPYLFNGTPSNGLVAFFALTSCCVRVYCDFDGYSNIARGMGKMMGFELSINFFIPGAAVGPKDLWRRFHITFYGWIRSYIFLPLVKNLHVPVFLAVLIAFVLSGLWHEVSLVFVVWGLYQGAFVIVSELPGRWIAPTYKAATGFKKIALMGAGIFYVQVFQAIGVAFFLAGSVTAAWALLYPVLNPASWKLDAQLMNLLFIYTFFSAPYLVVNFIQAYQDDLLAPLRLRPWIRVCLFSFLLFYFVLFGVINAQKFIYFHF